MPQKNKSKWIRYISENIKDYRQIKAVNRLIGYLIKTQKRNLEYLKKAVVITKEELLQMDGYSRNNLELTLLLCNIQQKFNVIISPH